MLAALELPSIEDLVDRAVPDSIRTREPLRVPPARSEADAVARLRDLAQRNEVFTSLIGMGYSDTVTPPVILRNVLEDPAWYTAYTPYQPEISPGTARSVAQLPDDGERPHRHGDRQRVLARRGDRRRRGDGDVPSAEPERGRDVRRRCGLPSADDRRGPDPGRADRGRGGRRRAGRRHHRSRRVRRAAAVPGEQRRGARPAPGDRAAPRAGCARRRRQRPPRARPVDTAGGDGRRCRRRVVAAFRGAARLRRPARGVLRHPGRAQAVDAGPARRRLGRRRRTAGAPARAPDA